jgi:hypothetical protein
MSNILDWLLTRGKEPSTWAGLAGIALAAGLSDTQWTAISAALAGIFGAVGVFLAEKGKS